MLVKKIERRKRLGERNERIRAHFTREWEKGYRAAKIIDELGSIYALDAITLEAIIYRKGVYKDF